LKPFIRINIKEIDKLSSGDTFSITNNEDFKELKGIEDSKLKQLQQ
jgi:hypothetical protein